MGYMRHHAIIVTGSYDDWVRRAWKKAKNVFPIVSEIQQSGLNNVETFFVPPDGSKEGWDDSDDGDRRRARFIAWLDEQRYEDGSSPLDWVEVFYGDDNRKAKIVSHNNESKRRERP